MRKVLKWSLRSIAAIAVLAVLLAGSLAFILNTESGTRWALARIDAAMAGRLGMENVSGTLWRGLQLSEVTYSDERRVITATDVTLVVDWSGAMLGDAAFEEFRADTLTIRNLYPPEPGPTPVTLSMQALPINVVVADLDVRVLTLPGTDAREISDIRIAAARIEGNVLHARRIVASGYNLNVTARNFRLAMRRDVSATADVTWSTLDGAWSGQGPLRGSLATLSFDQAIEGPYPMTAVGSMQLLNRTEPVFDAAVTWDDWTVGGNRILDGIVQVQGTTNSYETDYRAAVIVADERIEVSGVGQGNLERLTDLTARLDTSFGKADLTGSATWQPAIAVAVQVHATDIDAAMLSEQFHGTLEAGAHVAVDDAGTMSITDLAASGSLNGAALQGSGDITLASEQVSCADCSLSVGANRLRVDGQSVDNELALSLFLDAPNVQRLWPDVAGAVRAEGRLVGAVESPRFTGTLQGERLVFEEWAAASIAINSRDSGLDALDVRMDVGELRSGDTDYGSFKATGQGSPANLQFTLEYLLRGFLVDTAGRLRSTDAGFGGDIQRATISEEQAGDWQLQNAFSFEFDDGDFLVQPHTWSSDIGELRVSRLTFKDGEIAVVAGIDELPLSIADAFLPEGFALHGTATANIDVARSAGLWSGTLNWQQANSVLRVASVNEQAADVRIPRADLLATFQGRGVAVNAMVEIEPGVTGEVDLELVELDPASPMNAELRLTGDDWGWISAVVPDIDGFDGAINAHVSASGPLNAPEFSGDIVWSDGRVLLPALNVPLENVDLRVSGAANGTATLRGSAKAGSGTLAADGVFEELMQATRSVTLNVSGASAEIFNWPEYHVWASPDLTLAGNKDGWQLGGGLTIPRAEINIRELPVEAVTLSEDVVVVGEEDVVREHTRIGGEARIKLGDNVRIKALGLDTGLAGELLVKLHYDSEPTADGRITLVDGSFASQGQKLTIQKGELTFTGPLDNPIVDVRAVRVIENFDGTVTAGIHLHGRAQNLTSTVFSEPAMNEVDALSYLVIGRPLNQATEAEGGQLSGAAVSMGLRQASRLTDQIGQTLGLDQLSVTGDGGDTTALIAGKKVNSRLYARYAYGVFSRLGVLLLRYQLSNRLSLEVGAGEMQSIDVLYSVEKR